MIHKLVLKHILKCFLNKIKIPTIPPLLVNRTFETDFRKIAGIFNTSFADIINNGSVLAVINYKTHKRLTNITISPEDLSSMIKDLNPNKVHGHDNISIKMVQICGDTIKPPLKIIFELAIKSSHFPDSWKKGNIIVHKKESKNVITNYRPIFGKICEHFYL